MHPEIPDLRWSPREADVLAVLAEQAGQAGQAGVEVGRLCPACGSGEHGRPWARSGGRDVPVSASRAGAYLVTVVGTAGTAPVGVDVELVDRDWPLGELLAPGESVRDAGEAARLWVRKEAILKARGTGLAVPMTELVVAAYDGTLWEPSAPSGYVVAVAQAERR